MYKKTNNQIAFEDFNQPMGLKMNPKNRWIERTKEIPWKELEEDYAKLFPSKEGNVALPFRLLFGAWIIELSLGYSDEETVNQIQENPYLQFFVGLSGYTDERPFDPTSLVYFKKRLTKEFMEKTTKLLIEKKIGVYQEKKHQNQIHLSWMQHVYQLK